MAVAIHTSTAFIQYPIGLCAISRVIKGANSGYYGQPNRPTSVTRQQTGDKNDFNSCLSKVLVNFNAVPRPLDLYDHILYGRFAIPPANSRQY